METQQTTDLEFIQQVHAGNDAGFEELMRRYKKPVLNFVYRLLGNASEADDVAQETFVRAYQHLASYRPKEKLSTWLFAIARNAAIDRLRYRQRHPTESLSGIVAASPARGPAAEAANRELGAQIAAAVEALPEDQRTAIVLAEYNGLSQTEIAAIMDCSAKSVESRLYRAKATLRERLMRLLD
jgi:RNA polymerase sigma-70 factor (ECF subfamily)